MDSFNENAAKEKQRAQLQHKIASAHQLSEEDAADHAVLPA